MRLFRFLAACLVLIGLAVYSFSTLASNPPKIPGSGLMAPVVGLILFFLVGYAIAKLRHRMLPILLLGLLALPSCGTLVKPEYIGVWMENGGKNGLSDYSVVHGRVWDWSPMTQLFLVPAGRQTQDMAQFVVTSKDGGDFTVDPTFTFAVNPMKAAELIYKYKLGGGDGFLERVTVVVDRFARTAYIETAMTWTNDSLLANRAKYEQTAEATFKASLQELFIIENVTGNLRPPQSMREAIERKNTAIQEAVTAKQQLETTRVSIEQKKLEAEAYAQSLLIQARAEAEANRLLAASLSPLVVQMRFVEKWDGEAPLYGIGQNILLQRRE